MAVSGRPVGLSIGGTGMLARATDWLASACATTLVVSRHASRFASGNPAMVALDVDWSQSDFPAVIEARLGLMPPVSHALLWLHQLDDHLPALVETLRGARIVLVLGSMDGQPKLPDASGVATVRLGSMADGRGRRWLTNDEISAGAIEALKDGAARIVGDLRPLR